MGKTKVVVKEPLIHGFLVYKLGDIGELYYMGRAKTLKDAIEITKNVSGALPEGTYIILKQLKTVEIK